MRSRYETNRFARKRRFQPSSEFLDRHVAEFNRISVAGEAEESARAVFARMRTATHEDLLQPARQQKPLMPAWRFVASP